jgi:DNA-binding transcriptional MerR regulator
MRATRCQQVTQTGKARQMDAAIQSLLTCRTIVEAAEQCQVSRRTLHRWMKHERFKRQYDAAKKGLLNGAINRLRMAGFDSGKRLHEIVNDKETPTAAAVSAAGRILDLLIKGVELEDLTERITALEESGAKGKL